ncbi:hypothetical protein [Marinobacter sp. MDS2]|uniref:hypothetical protein n=1 Tax=Marinobacter sp. MDS2 TaxID=3065961 RepID=UPI00273B38E9|nr:hypothetical protein [Marinobacter sp. MDS2]MDP4546505.1 hypothetical protein [Marinobacter sp. MDS2]
MSQPTIKKAKRAEQAEIERQTAEFLAKGGRIQREPRRRTKVVDLTWRNYAQTAMEDAE